VPHASRPHVIGSVLPENAEHALAALARAPAACALVELRADRLRPADIAGVVRRSGRPLVVTVRRVDDGGRFEGSEEERSGALEAALAAGAAFVDLEWNRPVVMHLERARGRTILSDHGTPCTLDALRERVREMAALGPAALKVAAAPRDVDELLALRDVLAEHAREAVAPPLAAFGLGRAGSLSRLLAPFWGSWATYGALEPGAATGSGQLPAAEMVGMYDVLGISAATKLFALVGSRVARSPSPAMHLAGYRAAGLDARYFAIETDDVDAFVRLVEPERGIGIAGFGVTMPFKEAAARRSHAGDDLVRASGAANTVLVGERGFAAYNTDGPAALDCLREHLDVRGAHVVVLGAGGTARAVAAICVEEGARVSLVGRSPERAQEAARACGATVAASLDGLGWDVLVHATPRGADGERFLDPALLTGRVVLDAVYAVRTTALVADARERGLAAIDGLAMLAAQAALQFRRMTGYDAQRALLRRAAEAWMRGIRLDAP
jgi:3-dehydroquinate dehydratase/shikimate dehydrogenase